MRQYERTHPWINFTLDLRKVPALVWVQLGEAHSKCGHVGGVPLPPDVQREFSHVYLAKGVLATNAIEGNTLTEAQVRDHLEGRLELPPSQEYMAREIDNVLGVANQIFHDRSGELDQLRPTLVTEFNRRVLDDLATGEDVVPGQVRTRPFGVGRYMGAPAEDCDFLLERLCDWLMSPNFHGDDEMELPMAVIRAVLAHLYLAWIHPFGDGNGRTARLLELHILAQAGVPMPSAHLLSNHYNLTRAEYYRQLDYASQSGGDVLPFLTYAVNGFLEGLRAQVMQIRNLTWQTAWRDYVHDVLGGGGSPVRRRRRLVLALSDAPEAVPRSKLVLLTAEVAQAYAGRTSKTLSRDLNALERLKLVKRVAGEGYKANRGIMLAFAPLRKRKKAAVA